jgi:hypothetical protein
MCEDMSKDLLVGHSLDGNLGVALGFRWDELDKNASFLRHAGIPHHPEEFAPGSVVRRLPSSSFFFLNKE